LIKIIIKEENFKWHLEAFASELFICGQVLWGQVYLRWSKREEMCAVVRWVHVLACFWKTKNKKTDIKFSVPKESIHTFISNTSKIKHLPWYWVRGLGFISANCKGDCVRYLRSEGECWDSTETYIAINDILEARGY